MRDPDLVVMGGDPGYQYFLISAGLSNMQLRLRNTESTHFEEIQKLKENMEGALAFVIYKSSTNYILTMCLALFTNHPFIR